jgi:3-carboxy-cis,cis-muconate cycloisomerase
VPTQLMTTAEVAALFSPESRWQSWLDVEAALAAAQAGLGVIPEAAAMEIGRKARLDALDVPAMKAEMARSKASVLALVHALANACEGDAGHFVHWGGTTQNIILTGRVLQMRKVHTAILGRMANCLDAMARLAEDGAEVVMAGRTNLQHALPITFGFKVAAWIEEFTRFESRFRQIEPRLFSLVFGGAIGAMQAFGEHGPALTDRMGAHLGLRPVVVPTRAMLDHFVEYIMLLALFGTTCSKIAREAYALMSDEIGEVFEDLGDEVIGSSTMPQKTNPKICVSVIAKASRLKGHVLPAMDSTQLSHEGDASANQGLYVTIDAACPLAYEVVRETEQLMTCLRPVPERMRQNLMLSRGMIAAENVMMVLARITGRQKAHDIVHTAAVEARKNQTLLLDALLAMEQVRDNISEEALKEAMQPENYTGHSVDITRKSIAMAGESAARLRT